MSLWVLLTYVYGSFDTCPSLDVSSPTKQAGKSRLFEVLALLCARAWVAVSVTEAVLFRKIEADQPTLLLDEMDATFGKEQALIQGIRGVLDAGYRRGGTVPARAAEQRARGFRVLRSQGVRRHRREAA